MSFLASRTPIVARCCFLPWVAIAACGQLAVAQPFAIRVIDDVTGRGVPLVELRTIVDQTYVSDSNGYVAIDDPVLMGREAYFHVASHGYEHEKGFFGYRGRSLTVKSGGEATIKINRLNIADRLYRITGAGVYRDTVKLGKIAPIKHPLLNAQVCGQDTVQAIVKGDQIFWFWGDTDRLTHPLGQFNTSGAVSLLPNAGGLDPSDGIDLDYFVGTSGFSRPMFERENGILIWVHGAFTVQDESGQSRIVTHYSRRKSLTEQLSHGLAVLDESSNVFKPIVEFDKDEPLYPRGQSFVATKNGVDYIYFASPYATVRVPARWDAVVDASYYEAFTPLKRGSRSVSAQGLDRNEDGSLKYAWKRNTAPVSPRQLMQWIHDSVIEVGDNWFHTIEARTEGPLLLHAGSIHWNEYRKRWIMIAHQARGGPSYLGEVWYSESKQPEGPFGKAVRIATHDKYSFYNVAHHDFFDQKEGRLIYFEGTYTKTFSRTDVATPWYDYNQIMYRLDLSDEKLNPAFAR